jgi:ribosomal protein S18 acetylase RimI-like enzyme
MANIEIYNPSMQPALESCFMACAEALGWEYQPENRHSDMVNIETAYMDNGWFWCLFDNGFLIGMVAFRLIDLKRNVAELKRLYLLPEYQGNGYGDMLFKHALDYIKAQGYTSVRADTRQDRSASRHLLEKYRFRRIEQYNDNAFAELYYELDLTKITQSEESSCR